MPRPSLPPVPTPQWSENLVVITKREYIQLTPPSRGQTQCHTIDERPVNLRITLEFDLRSMLEVVSISKS